MMHGYNGFSTDVKEIFGSLINMHDLKVVDEDNDKIVFQSSKCFLWVGTEYTYVEIFFKENEEDQWMVLGPYLKAVYPEVKISFTNTSQMGKKEAILSWLHDLHSILSEYGIPFLSGDFSWRAEYEKQR